MQTPDWVREPRYSAEIDMVAAVVKGLSLDAVQGSISDLVSPSENERASGLAVEISTILPKLSVRSPVLRSRLNDWTVGRMVSMMALAYKTKTCSDTQNSTNQSHSLTWSVPSSGTATLPL